MNLLSPIEVKDHSFLAAGSTLHKDVPEHALAVARTKQRIVEGWGERRQKKKEAAARKQKDESEQDE